MWLWKWHVPSHLPKWQFFPMYPVPLQSQCTLSSLMEHFPPCLQAFGLLQGSTNWQLSMDTWPTMWSVRTRYRGSSHLLFMEIFRKQPINPKHARYSMNLVRRACVSFYGLFVEFGVFKSQLKKYVPTLSCRQIVKCQSYLRWSCHLFHSLPWFLYWDWIVTRIRDWFCVCCQSLSSIHYYNIANLSGKHKSTFILAKMQVNAERVRCDADETLFEQIIVAR